ncbi:MAG: head GIN domain-containing protein [Bacteroidota bacterium]
MKRINSNIPPVSAFKRFFNWKDSIGSLSTYVFRTVLVVAFLMVSCNNENAPDCLQNAGDITRITVDLPPFQNITVFERLNLVLKQGDTQKVEIASGEWLINEISAEVVDGRLLLRNNNGCNLFRAYGLSTVYVTSPNIAEVRSSTGLTIASDGVLAYPNLRLVSESFTDPSSETTSGTFALEVDSDNLNIFANGIAYFELVGNTQQLEVFVAAGDTRVEAAALLAEDVIVNHRGTNSIVVRPQESISGIIRGYGDVISINRPDSIAIQETFEGRLIFKD